MNKISDGIEFTSLLRSVGRNANSKVNKLISSIESKRNHRSIVLLLIELAENYDLYAEAISLQYYLDMFENLSEEPPLTETGLLLLNSAIIYGRRVDNIHFSVEKFVLSLINAENIDLERLKEDQKSDVSLTSNTVIKTRKRPLNQVNKTYEIEMNIKRFKAIPKCNRFEKEIFLYKEDNKIIENVIKSSIDSWIKYHINPLSWLFSPVDNLDYEDEIDLKKKYKLITYHLEHRYNTLTPDINFKMYFKIKDFIDAVHKDTTNTDLWPPPLSDAYIQRYIHLENQILHKEGSNENETEKGIGIPSNHLCTNTEPTEITYVGNNNNIVNIEISNHVDLKTSSDKKIYHNKEETLHSNDIKCSSDSECPPHDEFSPIKERNLENCNQQEVNDCMPPEDLSTVKVLLPHLDDEGVYFSELNEKDQQMLSPAVIATDVFRCIKDKSNIVVVIDDVIKRVYNIQEPKTQIFILPVSKDQKCSLLSLNFLKIDQKYFKKRRTFKLGPDFHLLKRERLNKTCHKKYNHNYSQMYVRLSEDVTGIPISPISSPSYDPDFYGFPDDILHDKNRSLSRDSGISLLENTQEQELNNDSSKQHKQFPFESNSFMNISNNNLSREGITMEENKYNLVESENTSPVSKNVLLTDSFTSLMTKVEKWHMHLQPLLMQSKDRHHFDIVKIGTEILEHFGENDNQDNIISFQTIMENKDSSLISRYFLSTLLLANQGNIGISVSSPNPDAPTDLKDLGLIFINKTLLSSEKEKSKLISCSFATEQSSKSDYGSCTTIRTLKSPYKNSKSDELDSGISMSDEYSI